MVRPTFRGKDDREAVTSTAGPNPPKGGRAVLYTIIVVVVVVVIVLFILGRMRGGGRGV